MGAVALSRAQSIISPSGYGDVTPHTYNGGMAAVIPGTGVQVSLPTPQAVFKIDLPAGTNWTGYTHLQVTVENTGMTLQPMFLAVASTGLWCFTQVQLPPRTTNTFIMPLNNAPVIGMYRLPQPSNDGDYQVFAGSSVDKPRVSWLMVKSPEGMMPLQIVIKDMHPIAAPIPATGIVDRYGQQTQVTWPGKITSDSQLMAANSHPLSGAYPFSADVYGGVNGTATSSSATGRWHTEKQNGDWYLIDPLGNRFFSSGIVGAGACPPAIVTGQEQEFANGALPAQSDPLAVHYWVATDPNNGNQVTTYNFYEANVQRRVGAAWRSTLVDSTVTRMRTWGFNTVGPSSNFDFYKPTTTLAFTDIVAISGAYSTIYDPSSGWKMPDVFDPAWAAAVPTSLAPRVTYLQGNAFNIGMFVDNELPWAKPFSSANARYGLCEDILLAAPTQPAKIAFVDWLQQRYSSIGALNTSWQTSFTGFDAILSASTSLPQTVPTGMATDMQDFTLLFARRYFTTVRQALTQLGYQGLYMGCRFLYSTPEELQACKESADVVSFNDYCATPTRYHDAVRALDAPLLISEVGFSACDLGRRPSGENLLTEKDRIWFYNRYVNDALAWHNLVGLHWYKWQDDVVSGRFYDHDNCCQGLVSITDIPYWQFVSAVTAANGSFQARLLANR
ncbi:MAG TPA: beta-galactosidase [Fimbriimonadaceae bacterium]|nr:beta-galactosidase [Fimbriimonadaceae bacterium]